MKQLPLVVILLLNVSFIYSQNVVVASERYNTVLVGVNNPLSIAVGNVPATLLVVKAKNGIVEGSNGFNPFQNPPHLSGRKMKAESRQRYFWRWEV